MTTENYKFTEQEFHQLFSDYISVGEARELAEKAGKRLYYILDTVCRTVGWKVMWYDWDNENQYDEIKGHWDSKRYKNEMGFVAEFEKFKNEGFVEYNDFPTEWLKIDFESIIQNDFAKYLAEEQKAIQKAKDKKARIQEIKAEQQKMQDQIWSKLSEQERAFVNFKSPEAVYEYEQKMQQKKMKKKP